MTNIEALNEKKKETEIEFGIAENEYNIAIFNEAIALMEKAYVLYESAMKLIRDVPVYNCYDLDRLTRKTIDIVKEERDTAEKKLAGYKTFKEQINEQAE